MGPFSKIVDDFKFTISNSDKVPDIKNAKKFIGQVCQYFGLNIAEYEELDPRLTEARMYMLANKLIYPESNSFKGWLNSSEPKFAKILIENFVNLEIVLQQSNPDLLDDKKKDALMLGFGYDGVLEPETLIEKLCNQEITPGKFLKRLRLQNEKSPEELSKYLNYKSIETYYAKERDENLLDDAITIRKLLKFYEIKLGPKETSRVIDKLYKHQRFEVQAEDVERAISLFESRSRLKKPQKGKLRLHVFFINSF